MRMERSGTIGWRAEAGRTYLVCTFLRSIENTIRRAMGAKRDLPMPAFEALFDPASARAPEGGPDGLDELERQLGF